jgi:ABC-type transport system substrate-binding protein
MVSRSIYETLVERTKSGYKPLLAESVTPSGDKKTWTVKLRSGITYHDGSALDADTLIKNFEALRGASFVNAMMAEAGAGAAGVTAVWTAIGTIGSAQATQAQKKTAADTLGGLRVKALPKQGHTLGTAIPFASKIIAAKKVDALTVAFSLQKAQ